ncbi:MAG: redoxin domain-containing protein, partial [Acidobacteriota bacterium]|nr:redoxin domain-containing protein [Acidobacteriota bacterium]
QKMRHQMRRAAALDAYGWVLCRTGKCREAEPLLRQAIELARSEKNLSHLAEALRELGHTDESERVAVEARNEYVAAIKRAFKDEPAKDFELSTIDGRKVNLSDLKGKLVMINFWATWCKPCVREMPLFTNAYDKYKERGFEILAISVDEAEDRNKVISFARGHKLNFLLIHDGSAAKLYGVTSFPTTFFIDRKGSVRYRHSGFDSENTARALEVVIEELMKESRAEKAAPSD